MKKTKVVQRLEDGWLCTSQIVRLVVVTSPKSQPRGMPDQDVDAVGVAGATLIIETDMININVIKVDIIEIDMPFSACAASCMTKLSDSASLQTSSGM